MKRYKKLSEAVLERAIVDLLKPIVEEKRRGMDWITAYKWIFDAHWPSILKFELCCDSLGLNADEVRRVLRKACFNKKLAKEILLRSKKMEEVKLEEDED